METVVIMGAAGRDFHDFNCKYRGNPNRKVVAFTATQIPDIDGRRYPAELAGKLYPKGIPIYSEEDLPMLIDQFDVDTVALSYSDLPFQYVMERASLVQSCGATFQLIGTKHTMIEAGVPVIAVCAARTGCGKSQVSRQVVSWLKEQDLRAVVIRHPMPYGNLVDQRVQRFATLDDLDRHKCTIEEREEYEPHIVGGTIVYAGVDYHAIGEQARKEADVIIWDGGNNDTSFYRADFYITLVDPHRQGHEETYYPGLTNLLLADAVIVNKVDTASVQGIDLTKASARKHNHQATIIEAASRVILSDPEAVKGKMALVVEDGPTVTHGDMGIGAGWVAADQIGCDILDPRPWAVGSIVETYQKYSHLTAVLPAMGYGDEQMADLKATINAAKCDVVISGTPIDLGRLLGDVNKPIIRVTYGMEEKGIAELRKVLEKASAGWWG